jgi:formylglycine-generating enzyme required for sulfatase activity
MRPDDRTDHTPTLIRDDADRTPVLVAVGDEWRAGVLPAGAEPLGEGFDEASGLPRRIRWLKDSAEMVLVPAGEFLMGSTDAEVNQICRLDKVVVQGNRMKLCWVDSGPERTK